MLAWNISGNATLNYNRPRDVALDRTASQATVNLSLNTSLNMGKLYTARACGGYGTGRVLLQSRYSGCY